MKSTDPKATNMFKGLRGWHNRMTGAGPKPKRTTGKVKFWNEHKYFGIIIEPSGLEVFAHAYQLRAPTNMLKEAAVVTYRREKGSKRPGKWRAVDIEGGEYRRDRAGERAPSHSGRDGGAMPKRRRIDYGNGGRGNGGRDSSNRHRR